MTETTDNNPNETIDKYAYQSIETYPAIAPRLIAWLAQNPLSTAEQIWNGAFSVSNKPPVNRFFAALDGISSCFIDEVPGSDLRRHYSIHECYPNSINIFIDADKKQENAQ